MAHALLLIPQMQGRVGSRASGVNVRRRPVAHLLLLATLVIGVGSRPALAGRGLLAQSAPAPSAQVARLEAECARLRVELARVNAEVATLKRGSRGVRGEYRLRDRMAEAESLARQLTRAETELRGRTGRPAAAPAVPTPAPSAAPGDGPVELEAKADLLVDEARRLNDQAAALSRTAVQLRGRQALRRRAADLERDPFATLDAPKRTMVFGAPRPRDTGEITPVGPPTSGVPRTGTTSVAGSNQPGPAPPAPPQPTAAIAAPIRTLLDPATMSEIQRLERARRTPSDPEALEKMASVLRQRAQALEAQARTVRPPAK
jgi:hypothetical protein